MMMMDIYAINFNKRKLVKKIVVTQFVAFFFMYFQVNFLYLFLGDM